MTLCGIGDAVQPLAAPFGQAFLRTPSQSRIESFLKGMPRLYRVRWIHPPALHKGEGSRVDAAPSVVLEATLNYYLHMYNLFQRR